MTTLPDDLENRINAELRPGERLVWTGRPLPSRFVPNSVLTVFFGIPWTAFIIYWMVSVGLFGDAAAPPGGFDYKTFIFALMGLPFLLIGLGLLSSPYWICRRTKRTVYALTDQRAIIFAANTFNGIEVRSFNAASLDKLSRREFANGSGDLIFQEVLTTHERDGEANTRRTERGFLGIENVREVENLLRQTLLAGE